MSSLDPRRTRVVEEAKSWLRTPYHHMGRIKGAGVDCLMLLAEVYSRAGIVPHVDISFYPPDWHLHQAEERYATGVLRYAQEYWLGDRGEDPIKPRPEPGDMALFKFGRAHAHGVIVIDWPRGIDAWAGLGVCWRDTTALREPSGRPRHARYFDPFA